MAQWQDLDGNADLDPLGAGADGGRDAERRRQYRALRIEMQLGQPHRVETPALGRIDLLESLGEGLFLAASGECRKLVEHAEFHRPISGSGLIGRAILQSDCREHTIIAMSEDTPNLVLEHLRAIRTELHEIREEQREQRGRLGSIERSISYMTREIAEMGLRLDRMHDRLDRIERRLDLAET